MTPRNRRIVNVFHAKLRHLSVGSLVSQLEYSVWVTKVEILSAQATFRLEFKVDSSRALGAASVLMSH